MRERREFSLLILRMPQSHFWHQRIHMNTSPSPQIVHVMSKTLQTVDAATDGPACPSGVGREQEDHSSFSG